MIETCILCKYFSFDTGERSWSEYTPGWSAEIRCEKDVWKIDMEDCSQLHYRRCMITAEKCEHFTLSDICRELGVDNS